MAENNVVPFKQRVVEGKTPEEVAAEFVDICNDMEVSENLKVVMMIVDDENLEFAMTSNFMCIQSLSYWLTRAHRFFTS